MIKRLCAALLALFLLSCTPAPVDHVIWHTVSQAEVEQEAWRRGGSYSFVGSQELSSAAPGGTWSPTFTAHASGNLTVAHFCAWNVGSGSILTPSRWLVANPVPSPLPLTSCTRAPADGQVAYTTMLA